MMNWTRQVGMISRRDFARRSALAASVASLQPGALLSCASASGSQSQTGRAKMMNTDAMDQALEMLAGAGPEFAGGLANHAPMAAEALVAMDRADAVTAWVERYKRRLDGRPESRKPIARAEWQAALGDYSRVADWIAFFNREFNEKPWRTVLSEWSARLSPGLVAAAMHGLLRTAHAARSLSQKESEARKKELAEGLAYWAARYQRLPEARASHTAGLQPSQAIKQVALLPAERRGRWLISDALRGLEGFEPFKGVADLVDPGADAERFLSDLTETFAKTYLANAHSGNVIALVHSVTGTSAIRLLLPYAVPEARRDLLRYGWQAAAAIYSGYGRTAEFGSFDDKAPKREELIERAVANGDDHAIKFTEACLREYAANPQPVYLLAARDAIEKLG